MHAKNIFSCAISYNQPYMPWGIRRIRGQFHPLHFSFLSGIAAALLGPFLPAQSAPPPPTPPYPSAQALIARAMRVQAVSDRALQNYECTQQVVIRYLRANGTVQKIQTRTYLASTIAGKTYQELIAKNGRPLSVSERRKQSRKLLRQATWPQRHPRQAARRQAKALAQRRALRHAIPWAFLYRLQGVHYSPGYGWAYVIQARPNPAWKPPDKKLKILKYLFGEIRVSCSHPRIVALHVQLFKSIHFGWILARIEPGARIDWRSAPGPKGMYFPASLHLTAQARILIFKHYRMDYTETDSHYRNFQVRTANRISRPKPTSSPAARSNR